MSQAYILTEEGRTYTQQGVDYVLGQIRNTFKDHDDVTFHQGALYNKPGMLAASLSRDPEHSYVFVSHDKGIEILYDIDDIHQFISLLDDANSVDETAWSIIMKALGLL